MSLAQDAKKRVKSSRARGQRDQIITKDARKMLGRHAKRLLDLLDGDDLKAAVTVWREGMKATKFVWDANTKSFNDTGFPDWQIRSEMAEIVVAYMEGKPLERQLQITGKFEELNEMMSRLSGSPAAYRAIERSGVTPKLLTEGTQGDESDADKADSPKGKAKKKDSES